MTRLLLKNIIGPVNGYFDPAKPDEKARMRAPRRLGRQSGLPGPELMTKHYCVEPPVGHLKSAMASAPMAAQGLSIVGHVDHGKSTFVGPASP